MLNNIIFEVIAVMSVFISMCLALGVLAFVIFKVRLFNVFGLFFTSIGTGLIFSIGSFFLITLSKKFSDWTLMAKIGYAGEIFISVFIGALLIIPIVFNRVIDKPKQ